MLAAEVGDVEALDPHRQRSQVERLLQRGERVDALLAAALPAEPVLGERQAGVALGQLAQPPLVAALGDPDLDRAAAPGRERLGEHRRPLAQRLARPPPAAEPPARPSSTGRGTPR